MCLVKSLLELLWSLAALLLLIKVISFKIVVVEVFIEILVVIDPGCYHVWVLLVEMDASGLTVEKHWFVVADVVSCECLGSIEKHLSPKVGVHARLVHGSVWFEVALNVELVFFKHQVDVLLVLGVKDLVKITAHTVLFIVEAIVVWSSNCETVLSHQLS